MRKKRHAEDDLGWSDDDDDAAAGTQSNIISSSDEATNDEDKDFDSDMSDDSDEEEEESDLAEVSDFDDGYGSDLMGDEEDRASLAVMKEVEREQVLYQRQQQRLQLKSRWEARKRRYEAQKKEHDRRRKQREKRRREKARQKRAKAKGRKRLRKVESDDDEDEDEDDSGDDAPLVSATSLEAKRREAKMQDVKSAMADIKQRRKDRASRLEEYMDDEDDEDDDMDDLYGDEDDDDDEYMEDGRGRRGKRKRRHEEDDDEDTDAEMQDAEGQERRKNKRSKSGGMIIPKFEKRTPMTVSDMRSIQIRRVALEKIIHEPYFDNYVVGKFVRVPISKTKSRAAEIVGVAECEKPYKFAGRLVKKELLLKAGGQPKRFKLRVISNQSITEDLVTTWRYFITKYNDYEVCAEEARLRLQQGERMRKSVKYSADVVQRMVEEKRRALASSGIGGVSGTGATASKARRNLALERSRLKEELARKTEIGAPSEELRGLKRRLDALEDEMSRQRRKHISDNNSVQRVTAINRRNLEENLARQERVARQKKKLRASGDAPEHDPFRRVSQRPGMSWEQSNKLEQQLAEVARKKAEAKRKKKLASMPALQVDTEAGAAKAQDADPNASPFATPRGGGSSSGSSRRMSWTVGTPATPTTPDGAKQLFVGANDGASTLARKHFDRELRKSEKTRLAAMAALAAGEGGLKMNVAQLNVQQEAPPMPLVESPYLALTRDDFEQVYTVEGYHQAMAELRGE